MKKNYYQMLALLAVAGFVALSTSATAQNNTGLRIAILGGVNYNYVNAPTQKFVDVPGNTNFALHDFSGASLFDGFAGLSGEYQFNSLIGATLRATYDARCVEKEDNSSKFSPRLVYVSIEPGIRLNLGAPELYAMVGGTVAIKAHTAYNYTPATTEVAENVTDADLQNVRDVAFGAWGGFGYDFRLNDSHEASGMFITPFAEVSYLFDQKKPDLPMQDNTSWNTMTVRAGLQFKVQF